MSTSFTPIIKQIESNAELRTKRENTLSPREMEVFEKFGEGLASKEVAASLGLSPKTIDSYVEHLKRKLGLTSIHKMRAIAAVCLYRKTSTASAGGAL